MKTNEIEVGKTYHNGAKDRRRYRERKVIDIVKRDPDPHLKPLRGNHYKFVPYVCCKGWDYPLSYFAHWAKGIVE